MKRTIFFRKYIEGERERREQIENDLNLRLRQQEAIAWFGEQALGSRNLDQLFQQAVEIVSQVLENEYTKVLELLPGGNALLLRAGVGWNAGLVGNAAVPAGADSQAGFTLLSEEPIIVDDLRTETRFSGPQLLTDHGVVSGLSVIIPGRSRPFGVLGTHTQHRREFTKNDSRFLVSIANILASAIDRFETEEVLRRSRDELAIILNGVSEGITAQTPDGRLIYANQAAAELIGYSSIEELMGTPVEKILDRFEMLDDQGSPIKMTDLPGRRVLQGEQDASQRIRFRVKATGEERWSIASARPVYGPNQKAVLAVNIFRGITEMVQRERSQNLLAEAGTILSSSFDYEVTLQNVARLAVHNLADWCLVYTISENGEVQRLALAARDPEKESLGQEYQQRYPDFNTQSPIWRVLQEGKPEYISEVPDELITASIQDPEQSEMLRQIGIRTIATVPMTARGRTVGAIAFVWSENAHSFDQEEKRLLEELAYRAAIAVDNARLYKEAQAINSELEHRVVKRTNQLEISNRTLLKEIEERRKAEEALKKSEALLNNLFELAPDATLLVDQKGKIVRLNRQAETIFGYQRGELVGKPVEKLIPARFHFRHPAHRKAYDKNRILRPMGAGLTLQALRKDGSEFPVDIMLSPVQMADGEFIISAIRDITDQKRLQSELAETQRRLFESIEAERVNLSQEIHDGPVQELYGVVLNLEGFRGELQQEELTHRLDGSLESVRSVLQTLRNICGDLRPPALTHFGLERAIRSHLMKTREAHPDIIFEMNLEADGTRLPDRIRLALFRVYQNALSNSLRHGRPTHFSVKMQFEDNRLRMDLEDNGLGFVVPRRFVDLVRAGHFGLAGMAERIEAVGGRLTIDSNPGKGTRIWVEVPVELPIEAQL